MLRKNFPFRKKIRQESAIERANMRAKRTNEQQIAMLDDLKFAATKERIKLLSKM